MNKKQMTYFQPQKVNKKTKCFKCGEIKESKGWFIDLFQKVKKKLSSICAECRPWQEKYYSELEQRGGKENNILEKIKDRLKFEEGKWLSSSSIQGNERKKLKLSRSSEQYQKDLKQELEAVKKEREILQSKVTNLKKILENQTKNDNSGTNIIYNFDCLELFKKMKENKVIVDAIITDPPYNISKNNNFASIGRAGIDFGHWDYGFDQTTWIKESYSLLKKGGSIIIFNDWRNFGEISKVLEEVGYEVKDLIRWIKKNPMPRNTNRRYVTDYELAIWAVKNGKSWTFNFKKNSNRPYLIPQYEGSVVIGGKRIHPTQKSLQVFKSIVELHTNVGDLVLDPFMGSGTTAVACQELGRNYIGSEIDSDYFNKAELRIKNCKTSEISTKEFIKSPINYTGNKYKLLKQILPFFPKKIDKFIDVFGGSGTVAVNVPAKKYFYNDNNNHAVSLIEHFKKNSYEFIVENVEKLIEKFSLSDSYKNGYERYKIVGNEGLSKYNKEVYKKLRGYYNETNDVNALFCLIIFGFNHQIRFNKKKLFNIPVGKADFNGKVRKNLKKFCEKLKNIDIEITNKDFFEFLEKMEINGNDLVYCDPPYLITDATYNDSWGIKEEEKLLRALDSLDKRSVKFALSNVIESNGRKNDILTKWAEKYEVNFLNFSYNNSNYQRKNKGKVIEVLITNYIIDKRK